MTVHMARSSTT